MFNYNNMFNKNILNIFSDASVKTVNETTYSCPGCIVVNDRNIIDSKCMIIKNSTNNDGEINGISLAVNKAIQYRDKYETINIISDSRISIQGLKYWMRNWIHNSRYGKMYNTEGKEVKNQNMFLSIVNLIAYSNLQIKFYHCKGHVNSNRDLIHAKDVFKATNKISDDVDMEIIKALAYYNNAIDNLTRTTLDNYNNYQIDNSNIKIFNYVPDKETYQEYKKLIGE